MKTPAHVFTALCILISGFLLSAPLPSKNTLVLKPVRSSLNLHWQATNKEVLIIAAPISITEAELTPFKKTNYTADSNYGKGTAIANGFVVYKGKSNTLTVNGLQFGQSYFLISYEADTNGDFTIAGPSLTSLTAISLGYRSQLAWTSSGDLSADKILVERSTDSKNWQELQDAKELPLTMPLQGTNFYDKGRLDGIYNYRIKHIYADGQTVTSEPVEIMSYTMDGVFNISPSEVYEGKRYFISTDKETELTITNSKGETIKKVKLEESNAYSYLFRDVPSGIYNIIGTNKDGTLNEKITVRE